MATIKPGVIGLGKPDISRKAEVIVKSSDIDIEPEGIKSLGIIKADAKTMDISEADIIVAVGRGTGQTVTFNMIEEIADLIQASLGGTRPAVDAGWISYDRQIGQTGKTVAPKLIISCGISGATQHTMGMKDSKLIIAINIDRSAPIFKIADVCIVTDLQEQLPILVDMLRQHKAAKNQNGE
jgi:electron transfer flavoprotein alpha subunit